MDDDTRMFGDLSNWYWYESQDETKIQEQRKMAAEWGRIRSTPILFQEQERGQDMINRNEAQNAGYQMATAFLGVFVLRNNAQASVILRLASKFAQWEGYRDLELGQEYMSGFLSAVFDAQPKQIKAEEK